MTQSYMTDEYFAEANLSFDTYSKSQDILSKGSLLEKHILQWCLENHIPLQWLKSKSLCAVSYEEIVKNPDAASRYLCDRLNLSNPQKMIEAALIPSRSPNSTRKNFKNKDTTVILNTWRKIINGSDQLDCSRIFDLYEIEVYNAYDSMPMRVFS